MKGFRIEGRANASPEAVTGKATKMVSLSDPLSVQLAHLYLHQLDLEGSRDWLNQIPLCSDLVITQALWHGAVTKYIKCFSRSRNRSRLVADDIYRGNVRAMEAFIYIKTMRDKFLIHDESAHGQAVPFAEIQDASGAEKIVHVGVVGMRGETLMPETYQNMAQLICDALTFVKTARDKVCDAIRIELQKKNFIELANLSQVDLIIPEREFHPKGTV